MSDEVARLFGTELAAVGRFEPDGEAIELWAPTEHTSGGNWATPSHRRR